MIGDCVNPTEWRRQREALLDRLYHLETDNGGRKRDEHAVAENIARINQRIAELDAAFQGDASV